MSIQFQDWGGSGMVVVSDLGSKGPGFYPWEVPNVNVWDTQSQTKLHTMRHALLRHQA